MRVPANFGDLLNVVVAMGETLNLSHAAKRAGVSRPTLRRHLQAFEKLCGNNLFELDGQSYRVTGFGEQMLPRARRMLDDAKRLMSSEFRSLSDLRHASLQLDDGWFRTQQHCLNSIWSIGPESFRACFHEWASAKGQLEHDAIRQRRSELVVLRHQDDDWICVEVGEQSAMAQWLGWEWAKSAIGRPISQNPTSNEANRLLIEPLEYVKIFGGGWYDHVSARFPRPDKQQSEPVNYQRLVLHCTFPDQSPAIITLVEVTDDVIIEGSDPGSRSASSHAISPGPDPLPSTA